MKRYVTELISTYKGEKCHYRSKSYIGHKNYHLKIGKWAFLVAQMVKNPPAVWETWVPSLGREGGGHGNPLQYSCLENPRGQRSLEGYSPWSLRELDTTE